MKTSEKGLALVKAHEGLRLNAYLCPAKIWTIGYGHTKNAKDGLIITEQKATELLKSDLKIAETCVNKQELQINQNQFDALVSFVFNVGCLAFKNSTLLCTIKNGCTQEEITKQFNRWVNGGGRKLPGLIKRRKEESALYFEI